MNASLERFAPDGEGHTASGIEGARTQGGSWHPASPRRPAATNATSATAHDATSNRASASADARPSTTSRDRPNADEKRTARRRQTTSPTAKTRMAQQLPAEWATAARSRARSSPSRPKQRTRRPQAGKTIPRLGDDARLSRQLAGLTRFWIRTRKGSSPSLPPASPARQAPPQPSAAACHPRPRRRAPRPSS